MWEAVPSDNDVLVHQHSSTYFKKHLSFLAEILPILGLMLGRILVSAFEIIYLNLLGDKKRPARRADNLDEICEPNV
jgi:hypothetical protein